MLVIADGMTRGVATPDALLQVVLHMHESLRLDVKEIVHLTNIPQRTVYRMLTKSRESDQPKPKSMEKRGRPRTLDFADTQVGPHLLGSWAFLLIGASSLL